jgi:hypothetical protein
VFAGNGDTVDLSGAITSYSFKTTGTQLQISDGTYTTTLSVGGTFTLRTASGSTSVAIDFTAGGAIKLGGTQIVGSQTFDPLAAITNVGNRSANAGTTISDNTTTEITILGFVISGNSSVNEGQSTTLVIGAQGVADGTIVPYTLSGSIDQADISGALTGSFTVTNGQGQIVIPTKMDRITEGNEQLVVTLGGIAAGTPTFVITVIDIGLTPVAITNSQSFSGTLGKIDTFVIDADRTISATINGFEAGDLIQIRNRAAEDGVVFENAPYNDGMANLLVGASVTISLTGLSSDLFESEDRFEEIYGPNAITYVASAQASASQSSMGMALSSVENDITFGTDYDPTPSDDTPLINVDLSGLMMPEGIVDIDVWAEMRSNGVEINLTDIGANYFDDKTAFKTSILPDAIHYVL